MRERNIACDMQMASYWRSICVTRVTCVVTNRALGCARWRPYAPILRVSFFVRKSGVACCSKCASAADGAPGADGDALQRFSDELRQASTRRDKGSAARQELSWILQ